jgi:FemAB-related protein (PEP-CTERM system-associated)
MSFGQKLDVRIANDEDLDAWQLFVDRTPNAGCMHHAGWYRILRDAYWVTPYFLIAEEQSNGIAGVLPLYHSRSPLTGSHLSTLEGGVLATYAGAARALLAEARSLRDAVGAKYLQVRGGMVDEPGPRSFMTVDTVIDTSQAPEQLWRAVKKKTRWAIRQVQKTQIRVERDTDLSNLDVFYSLYAEHMRDLGTPVQGRDAFLALKKHLGQARLRLYLVEENNRKIGGMLCILNQGRWTDYYAIVRPSEHTEFANYLLYWSVISDAAACGGPILDLGRSTPGTNVHLFKRKWGGRDVEVAYHFYPSKASVHLGVGLEELKRGKGLPQRVWSHLPLWVGNRLGPLLRKQLPFI